MKKITYCVSAIFLMLLSFSNISRAAEGPLSSALDNLAENSSQYQIVLYSLRKWYEYCDIEEVYQGKTDIVLKFKFRGKDTRLTLSEFDEQNANAAGSFPISRMWGFSSSIAEVQLKFNADGTANGTWKDLGTAGDFYILKKGNLDPGLDKLVNNYSQYKIALVSLNKGQEDLDILGVYKEDKDIIIKFQYRGETRLILNEFDDEHSVVRGEYILKYGITTTVEVELIFNADGTANGKWIDKGIRNDFKIIKGK
ncbi:MAG: hypothetical protein DRR19_29455 [Candidatus Parabeggiatoa sp. nov. 1]|nr:MAG: hypothetical protein DRR19_29455 [Gammaproteobacteria bacterium]